MRDAIKTFTPDQFRQIADLDPNLRAENIAAIWLSRDGTAVRMHTTDTALRAAEKRVDDYEVGDGHAVYGFTKSQGEKIALFVGTPGVQSNAARIAVTQGIAALLEREGKITLICASPTDNAALGYYVCSDEGDAPPVDLATVGIAEAVYLSRPHGFLGRKVDDNRLYFLAFLDVKAGQIAELHWRATNPLQGYAKIVAMPQRITDARAVMVQVKTSDGQDAHVTLNLAAIDHGAIVSIADELGTINAVFLGFTNREVGVVEFRTDNQDRARGTYLVQRNALGTIFGQAGLALAQATR